MLETETARALPQFGYKAGAAYEYQFSADGKEAAVPLDFEVGITHRLELLVEPVAYTSIRPSVGQSARGFGDTEATLIYKFHEESAIWPALALAGEIKFPTASDPLIGTGKTDYASYLIASKQFGAWDIHLNLGYTIYGQPAGATGDNRLTNRASIALAAVYHINDRYDVFAEVLNNSLLNGGSRELNAPTGTAPPALQEGSVGETVGTVGIARQFGKYTKASFSVSFDNNSAVLLRPGIEFEVP